MVCLRLLLSPLVVGHYDIQNHIPTIFSEKFIEMKLFPSFCISFAFAYDNECCYDSESMQEWENAFETWKSDFKSRGI